MIKLDNSNNQKNIINMLVIMLILSLQFNYLFVKVVVGRKTAIEDRYSEIEFVRQSIKENYYKDIPEEELDRLLVDKFIGSLGDAYSFYMDPQEYRKVRGAVDGVGVGIGIQVVRDNGLKVTYVNPQGPAYTQGIERGDELVRINEIELDSYAGNPLDLIPKEIGIEVGLTVRRNNELLDKKIEVSKLEYEIVKYEVMDSKDTGIGSGRAGYISLTEFSTHSSKEFEKAVRNLKGRDIDKLIIDLRNNPGGVLSESIKIMGHLGIEGSVTVKSKDKDQIMTSKSNKLDIPLIVLVNGNSASASEIVAYNIQLSEGIVLGETTYGKGYGQVLMQNINSGSGVIITTLETIMPDGYTIEGKGVNPDIYIEQDPEIVYSYTGGIKTDAQLMEALWID